MFHKGIDNKTIKFEAWNIRLEKKGKFNGTEALVGKNLHGDILKKILSNVLH